MKLYIRKVIYKVGIKILILSGLYKPEEMATNKDWKPGYVRYFNILWYPKEGWINVFHNCQSDKEINSMLGDVYARKVYAQTIPKDSPQYVVKAKKRS